MYLLEAAGRPFDLYAAHGTAALTYAQTAAPAGLDTLAGRVDGISVDKRMILAPDKLGRTSGASRVVGDAHERGLRVYTWTCRPENRFLIGQFRTRGGPSSWCARSLTHMNRRCRAPPRSRSGRAARSGCWP